MKKKTSLKKRFRYWLDFRMAKGTASMVKLLLTTVLSSVTIVTILVLVFNLYKEGKTSTRIVTIVTELKTVVSNSLTILAVPLAILKSSQ